MKILAVEFSSAQRSVAAFDSATGSIAEVIDGTGGPLMKTFALIESALQQAKIEREQIGVVAIGIGPGSYTGIRAALALAQGWQLARGVRLCGISSVQCLATQKATDDSTCKFNVVIDAQRGEFYLATYELSSGAAKAVSPLRIVHHETVRAHHEAGEVLIGPEVTKWFPASQQMFPRAATLAKVSATGADLVAGEKLQPIYLREIAFVKTTGCLVRS